MNHSQIQRRAIAKTRKPILPLLRGENSPKRLSRIEPLNRVRSSASILPIRGNEFPLSPGEWCQAEVRPGVRIPRTISRIEPLNRSRSSASILPRRGNEFSLSPGERAGVRASVKPFSTTWFHYFTALNSERRFMGSFDIQNGMHIGAMNLRRFMERVSVKLFRYSAFYARKPARPEVPLDPRRRGENAHVPLAMARP